MNVIKYEIILIFNNIMQQQNYEEEFAKDLDELRSLSPGPPRLF